MANNNEKRYCVIDHANKRGDRKAINPNRQARRAAFRQQPEPAESPAHGSSATHESREPAE